MKGNGDVSTTHVVILFVLVALLIAVVTTWTMQTEDTTCTKKCGSEGLYPIYVAKAATCLCYDSAGVMRVPADPAHEMPDTDDPVDTAR